MMCPLLLMILKLCPFVPVKCSLQVPHEKQIPLRFSNKAAIIRSPALGPACGERVEYSSFSMFIDPHFFLFQRSSSFFTNEFFWSIKLKKCKEKEGPAVQVDSRGILACVAKGDHRTNRGKVSLCGSSRQSGAKIYLPPDFHRQAGGKERAKEHTVAYFNVLDVGSALQAFTWPLSGYALL